MVEPYVPSSKLGTPFQSPSWRWQAVSCPERFGFGSCCSKIDEPNSANLKRLITNGIRPVETFHLPVYLRQLNSRLPSPLYRHLLKVWQKHYFRNRIRKITFNTRINNSGLINWNLKKLNKINDEFFKRLIRYCYNVEGDEYIAAALLFFKNEAQRQNCKWLNYSIYSGMTDKELALSWKKPVKFIEALRLIFFDYSGWPNDRLVQYSLIRQMVENGEIDAADHHVFRRIYDLGEVGLRSVVGHGSLTPEEQDTVKTYLGGATADNLMNQRFCVSNLKESILFNQGVAQFANLALRKDELKIKAELMRLEISKTQQELGTVEDDTRQIEDNVLLDNMREIMQRDEPGEYPSYIDVIVEEKKPA